jgi:hypothetical protein
MHIATPADQLANLAVGDTVQVHSFGNLYRARVAELKGKRARCVWTNKSGNEWDKWITIPGLRQHELNPVAAATRKLRAEATRRVKYAEGWMTESVARHEARLVELEALRGATPTSEDTRYGTRMYHVGDDSVWGGYLKDGVLTFEQAVERAIAHEREQLEQRRADITAAHAHAKELRAKADSIEKGAK